MRVLAISGSLRRDSHNTTLLRAAAELLPPSVELEIFDGLKAVEPYDQDDDRELGPEGARRLAVASAGCRGARCVFCTSWAAGWAGPPTSGRRATAGA